MKAALEWLGPILFLLYALIWSMCRVARTEDDHNGNTNKQI